MIGYMCRCIWLSTNVLFQRSKISSKWSINACFTWCIGNWICSGIWRHSGSSIWVDKATFWKRLRSSYFIATRSVLSKTIRSISSTAALNLPSICSRKIQQAQKHRMIFCSQTIRRWLKICSLSTSRREATPICSCWACTTLRAIWSWTISVNILWIWWSLSNRWSSIIGSSSLCSRSRRFFNCSRNAGRHSIQQNSRGPTRSTPSKSEQSRCWEHRCTVLHARSSSTSWLTPSMPDGKASTRGSEASRYLKIWYPYTMSTSTRFWTNQCSAEKRPKLHNSSHRFSSAFRSSAPSSKNTKWSFSRAPPQPRRQRLSRINSESNQRSSRSSCSSSQSKGTIGSWISGSK